jgi:hypothetical protein
MHMRPKAMAMRTLAAALAASTTTGAAPSYQVERWDVPGVSSAQWESHPAIDPRTGDLWFVRSDEHFAGWKLMISRRTSDGRSSAEAAPIAAPGLEADPYFTADGNTLYFISTRATGKMTPRDLDLWEAHRDAQGNWSAPQRLPEPVNSPSAEWFPRPAKDGWLYFGSHRQGGLGQDDIWRARLGADGKWQVENAGAAINSAEAEYEFEPAADGRWALLATSAGVFRVAHGREGWQSRERLGPEINVSGAEIGPMLMAKDKAFAFSRDAGDGKSGEFYIARAGGKAASPPGCAAATPSR